MTPCPFRDQLVPFLGERLDDAAQVSLMAHVETCPECQARLEELTAAGPATGSDAATPDQGAPPGVSSAALRQRLNDSPPCRRTGVWEPSRLCRATRFWESWAEAAWASSSRPGRWRSTASSP